ncbi:MAG: glycosyltransferase family 1 protein [Planctomycetes bacterium]|nr:glycosyltransferase family 1 protein [Planctomycetota bacterium]
MRIAVDASCCFNRRGFGRFARELLAALARRSDGFDFVLLVDRDAAPGDLPEPLLALPRLNAQPGRSVTDAAVAGDARRPAELFAFTRAARRCQADLLFLPAVYSAFPLWPGTRAVVCFHDAIAETFPRMVFPDRKSEWFWRAKSWLAARQATRVMTVSEASRRDVGRVYGIAADRIDVVSEGADARFRPPTDHAALAAALRRLRIPEDRPYFLFVGGISPHKNLATLLTAFSRLLANASNGASGDATLVLVGDPKADGFLDSAAPLRQQIAADARLAARVHWTGFVADDDLVPLYQGACALVLPSLLEGFGLPALEAMSCATPVVASDAGSLPEVVGDGGLLVPALDAMALQAALSEVLGRPQQRALLAAKALARSRRFTWERGAADAVACFRRAVATEAR